jgi:hypothetical protein
MMLSIFSMASIDRANGDIFLLAMSKWPRIYVVMLSRPSHAARDSLLWFPQTTSGIQ